jgi:hypothetical protein
MYDMEIIFLFQSGALTVQDHLLLEIIVLWFENHYDVAF